MICASAKHPGAPPHEILVSRHQTDVRPLVPSIASAAASDHVWFLWDRPSAINSRVVKSERLVRRASAPQRRLPCRIEHRCFTERIIFSARFQHQNFYSRRRQHISALASGCSRTNDNYIVRRLCFIICYKRHGFYELLMRKALVMQGSTCHSDRFFKGSVAASTRRTLISRKAAVV